MHYGKLIRLLRSRIALLLIESRSKFRIPFFTRVRLLSKGFLSESYVIYQLEKNKTISRNIYLISKEERQDLLIQNHIF